MRLHLRVFALLIGRERLIERGIGFRVRRNRLRHQVADGVGRLVDRRAIVPRDRALEPLVRRLHLFVQRLLASQGVGEDGGGLLLLSRRESQLFGQEIDPMLNHLCRIGRLVPLPVAEHARHCQE